MTFHVFATNAQAYKAAGEHAIALCAWCSGNVPSDYACVHCGDFVCERCEDPPYHPDGFVCQGCLTPREFDTRNRRKARKAVAV